MALVEGQMRRLFPVAAALAVGLLLSFLASAYVDRQIESDSATLFELDAASATAEIEREIERHIGVVEETTAFARATWPGDLEQWRTFTDGRITGGTHFAFSSTAGVIERIPANQIDDVEARETANSGQPFQIIDFLPPTSEADRLVLTRTGEDTAGGITIRGIEVTSIAELLEVELPTTADGIAVDSIEQAPESVLQMLNVEEGAFDDNSVINTNVLLSHAIGYDGQEPLGWVIIPAELGYLLTTATENLDRSELNIAIAVPDTELAGDLGRYEGDPGLSFEQATLTSQSEVNFGGWNWQVSVWADEDFGISPNRIRGDHVFLGGIFLTLAFILFARAQRRYRRKLRVAEFEADLQRTLAETDPLTGLLNRQGLLAVGRDSLFGERVGEDGCATLFLDLDGFKIINDELGHAAGDEILVAVGRAISDTARTGDVVARLGGDEFVLVCPGLSDASTADAIASRLSETIRSIEQPASVDVSIGIALTKPGTTFDFDEALSEADGAMYIAKRAAARMAPR